MEVRLAESLLPAEPGLAPLWSVAVMELGALICTADRPRCPDCPVVSECAWHRAGQPAGDPHQARRRSQGYAGTDRQCRGRLLAVLRESDEPVPAALLDAAWADERQRARALASLVADGLAEPLPGGSYALPR
jgi:A/G-specific adenine glycosylase